MGEKQQLDGRRSCQRPSSREEKTLKCQTGFNIKVQYKMHHLNCCINENAFILTR